MIEAEVYHQRNIERKLEYLEMRYDHSVYGAFRTIDRYNDGYIDSFNLQVFLKNLGYYATSKDILAIIRRIDTDGDAKISYSEFSDALRTSYPSSRPVSAPPAKDFRSRSANKYGVRKEFSSPMK